MRRLPLLVGVTPKKMESNTGPDVPVSEGVWGVMVEGLVDSHIAICRGSSAPAAYALKQTFVGGERFHAVVTKAGTETNLSVYLTKDEE